VSKDTIDRLVTAAVALVVGVAAGLVIAALFP
jgi:uncharacterized membrane-anchored protein YhcB (DUF1043 family)